MKVPAWDLGGEATTTQNNKQKQIRTFKENNKMLDIKKTYVTDENKRPIAVQIDIKTFERIEQTLEDHALAKLIEENDPAESLSLNESKEYYDNL